MKLTKHQLKIIPLIQRKYNVSIGFLKSNLANIEKFLWYALSPRLVIKRIAIRKGSKQRVILNYYHLRRVLFDQAERKVIKTRRRNVQQWSRQMVCYLRRKYGVKEHIEITSCADNIDIIDKATEGTSRGGNMAPEEVSKQLKEQLELLRSGKRTVPLIESESKSAENEITETDRSRCDSSDKTSNCAASYTSACVAECNKKDMTDSSECSHVATEVLNKADSVVQSTLERTPEKQIIGRVETRLKQPKHSYKTDRNIDADGETVELPSSDCPIMMPHLEKLQPSAPTTTSKSLSGNSNFLDMLMNKVRGKNILTEVPANTNAIQPLSGGDRTPEKSFDKTHDNNEHFTDSGEEFFGFDETERLPGMMLTPLVPFSAQSKGNANVAFVSESLNEFMRENLLESSGCIADNVEGAAGRKHRQATLDGLVTPECVPPRMEMPLVPESLQKLRTVAERRQYLQKFNRNHKLAIINNEAAICRELQRKMRHHKSKSVSQQLLQAPNSQMPFTRQGWQAASFVTTEFNHYYYQTLDVRDGQERLCVRLPGVRGNNEERNKQSYYSRVPSNLLTSKCNTDNCSDALVWRDLKPVKTEPDKKKLNKSPLPSVFKPCPLSHKPFQKPLDDETAPLLLAGGSMAVVRMPIVELEVFPALGKPLHEVAKRYLEYILPHCDITREWAEFSVSTLQQSTECKKKENTPDQTNDKVKLSSESSESFSFPIPYQNDRSHILVRRVVDRSEKLDETFETATSPVEDFSFRANIDESDDVLVECADVLSEMINSVAISCSENSFIKSDPDELPVGNDVADIKHEKVSEILNAKDDKICNNRPALDDSKMGNQAVANKKQNRLLLELRRLNATIIDAAVKAEKGVKPCTKEYCALGCVCKSLADDYPLRQHCGKSRCVIECACKSSNQSRIMRLETDGRSITTEDAFMLRRQATARLARMEKEFTSTIVLTENETLLINESQYDKKRRCTKAPKRYEDFADTDDDYIGRSTANTPPKKTQNAAVVSIEAATESSLNSGFSETSTELREPIYVKDKVLEKLKHCTIPLVRFEGAQNMAVWCMVHELYKCYCGGRATEGKPLVIEKDTGNHAIACSDQTNLGKKQSALADDEYVVTSTKARYSFEKLEEEPEEDEEEEEEEIREENENIRKRTENRRNADLKSQGSSLKYISTDDEESGSDKRDEPLEDPLGSDFDVESCRAKRPKMLTKRPERRGRPSEMTFINKYFNTASDGCRRVVVVPRKTYLRMNRKRRAEVQDFIAKHENKQSMLLLNEHILRSVYYHKHEVEKQRKEAAQDSLLLSKKRKLTEGENSEKEDEPIQESITEPVAKKPLNDEDRRILELTDEDSCQSSLSSILSTSSSKPASDRRLRKRSHRQQRNLPDGNSIVHNTPEFVKSTILEEYSNDMADAATSAKSTKVETLEPAVNSIKQVKKLSDIENSNNDNELTLIDAEPSSLTVSGHKGEGEGITDFSSAASECSAALSLNMQPTSSFSHSRIDFFKDVVRSMNSLVNKKMQDIGLALKRESKVIPAPNDEILCIIKWSNFLDAFIEGFVFIWEVKLRDEQTFFAATISNMMPMVLDAVGVVNIAALPMKQLPLLGRMLLQRCRSPQTCDLAIVMQGRLKYWLVKGFLRADKSSACAKPTPKSHPLLTRKINVLSTLLAKQHIRELNKKVTQKQKEQHPDTSEEDKKSTTISTQSASPEQHSLLRQQLSPPVHREQKTISASNSKNSNTNTRDMQKTKQVTTGRKRTLENKHQPAIVRCPVTSSTSTNSALVAKDKSKAHTGLSMLQELINNSEYSDMKTNIALRKVTSADVDDLHGLDVTTGPHRWLVLELYKDFSHIYVPDFRELLSLDRIQKVMAFSRQKQKIVKLQFFLNAAFDAFVTPSSQRKIYFGPLKLNMPPPLLILLQSVDGRMMLRESYQQMHNIRGDSGESTTGFWMVRKNGQLDLQLTDSTEEALHGEKQLFGELKQIKATQQNNAYESDDDDCMIVDTVEPQLPFSPLVPLSQPSITVKPLAELQSKPNQAALSRQLTNFTIQKSSNSNRLQITNVGTTAEVLTSQLQKLPNTTDGNLLTSTQMPIKLPLNTQIAPLSNAPPGQQITSLVDNQPTPILCGLPPNAVITGVTPAPQEAPYATTIFISNLGSTAPTAGSGAQLLDKQVASITQPTSHICPAPILSKPLTNSRFLTPDVRVTTTVNSVIGDAVSTPVLTTVSNINSNIFSSPIAELQNEALDKNELLLSTSRSQSTTEVAANFETTTTVSIVRERQQLSASDSNAPNNSSADWKRFLLDEHSKTSTIGSTTITKMVEKHESTVRNLLPDNPLEIPTSLEEDEFEPAASIVFKQHASQTSPEANDSRSLAPKVSVGNVLNSYPTKSMLNTSTTVISITAATATATATASTLTTTTIEANTKTVPMTLAQPVTTSQISSSSKTDTVAAKSQVMALPLRNLPTKVGQNTFKQIIAKSTSLPYGSSAKITKTNAAATNSSAISKTSKIMISKVNTLKKSCIQQFKMPSQPLKLPTTQSSGSRLSLPASSRISATKTTMSPMTNISSPAPKPLINVRPAVSLPQRMGTGSPTTQRRSDSALLGPSMVSKKVGGIITARTGPTQYTVPQKSNVAASTSRVSCKAKAEPSKSTAPNNSNTTFKSGESKPEEQYGIFCSGSADSSPRFWAKRVKNAFIIKVPGLRSVVHRPDLESVDTYLNQHLLWQSPAMKSKLPIKWKFVPSDQLNLPIKMLTTNKDGRTTEKVLVRRVKVAESGAPAPKVTSPRPVCKFLKDVANAAASTPDTKCSEPILIED
ncbi:uncharacterized protein LOC128868677 isoform X2 [Anastrepha ludens]|nr:uncharacterized protein LOC128868677 isoform X2 [Anastrepha ludens]XP_053967006.1 uncharacterized protein LOC128868677 isoform X2 [Anastrepha ludens]